MSSADADSEAAVTDRAPSFVRSYYPLAARVALVTGAGRGIGREIALGCARAGMRVGLLGRNRPALDATLSACASAGAKAAVAVPADVTRFDAVKQAVRTVERDLGPVDLLVNSAGAIDKAEVPPWATDADDWWQVVQTNLRGPYHLCRAVVPGMVERGRGHIVNLASGFAHRPSRDYSAYAVSKAGLSRLTDSLAAALEGTGVVVVDISPGLVRTDMTARMRMWSDAPEQAWNPADRIVDAVLAVAAGHLDVLSGRFVHASKDDLDLLVAQAADIVARDSRTLRLRSYGDADPLG
jgi:3-oxoacyl-[acyl-carrier protein] reductase